MRRIEDAVKWAVEIALNYDQVKRNDSEYDCFSFIEMTLNNRFNVGSFSTTHNLYSQLIDCGFKMGANRKRGDIFFK